MGERESSVAPAPDSGELEGGVCVCVCVCGVEGGGGWRWRC